MRTRAHLAVPDRLNKRGSLDFVSDTLTDGRRFSILAVVDYVTRECIALVGDTSISDRCVSRETDAIIALRGRPKIAVSDKGTEVTSVTILRWSQKQGICWYYIAPRCPAAHACIREREKSTQNAFIEIVHARLGGGRRSMPSRSPSRNARAR